MVLVVFANFHRFGLYVFFLVFRNFVWLLTFKTGVFDVVSTVVGIRGELMLFLAQGIEIVLYANGF